MTSVPTRLAVVTALAFALGFAGCNEEKITTISDQDSPSDTDEPRQPPSQEVGSLAVDSGVELDPQCVPRDLAYWRTAARWPITSLELGGRLYNGAEMRAILAMDASGDVSVALMQELIVTWLNFCDGCLVSPDVQNAMDECESWMVETSDLCMEDGITDLPYCQPDAGDAGARAHACMDRLAVYNHGG